MACVQRYVDVSMQHRPPTYDNATGRDRMDRRACDPTVLSIHLVSTLSRRRSSRLFFGPSLCIRCLSLIIRSSRPPALPSQPATCCNLFRYVGSFSLLRLLQLLSSANIGHDLPLLRPPGRGLQLIVHRSFTLIQFHFRTHIMPAIVLSTCARKRIVRCRRRLGCLHRLRSLATEHDTT